MRARAACAALLFGMACFAQDLDQIQVERVAAGMQFTDGPVWSREGFLLFSDIPSNRILRLELSGSEHTPNHVTEFRAPSGGATGNAFDAQGRLYTCESHARRVTRTDKKGRVDVLAERWEGHRFNSPNDVAVRHDGHVYFTDPAFGSANEARELDFYGVFHITPKGELEMVAKWKTRPRGVALSPDGKTLYVSDADRHLIRAYDLDHAGAAGNERVIVSAVDGVPGGLRTDEKGKLYVAARTGVDIYTPDGKHFGLIPLGETPSNCAFGDDDGQTLYITSRAIVYRTRLNVKGSAP